MHPRGGAATSPSAYSSTTSSPSASTTSGQGSAQITAGKAISSDNGLATTLPEPNLDRPYTPPSDLPAEVQATDREAVAGAVAQLKIDPSHLAYWLQLAIYRKGADDYTGAEEIWLYCVARWPTDPTAYNNLADLYGNYLHEYDKAVTYWSKLIALQPNTISAYINLATLYDINMHDAADAKATIAAGLKANPNNPDLLNAQKQYE